MFEIERPLKPLVLSQPALSEAEGKGGGRKLGEGCGSHGLGFANSPRQEHQGG